MVMPRSLQKIVKLSCVNYNIEKLGLKERIILCIIEKAVHKNCRRLLLY